MTCTTLKWRWLAVVVAVPLLSTGVAAASSGYFSTGGRTPALTAVNSGLGDALGATSASGNAVAAHANGRGSQVGVYGVTQGAIGAGVRGDNRGSGGGPGVLGVGPRTGVVGRGAFAGVEGNTGGRPGDGSFGLLSQQDVRLNGHIVASNSDIGGTCVVPTGAAASTCAFTSSFGAADPIVIVTSVGDPGGYVWVSDATSTGFRVHVSAVRSTPLTVNFVVVGRVTVASSGD